MFEVVMWLGPRRRAASSATLHPLRHLPAPSRAPVAGRPRQNRRKSRASVAETSRARAALAASEGKSGSGAAVYVAADMEGCILFSMIFDDCPIESQTKRK
jgi:hypothetical protein